MLTTKYHSGIINHKGEGVECINCTNCLSQSVICVCTYNKLSLSLSVFFSFCAVFDAFVIMSHHISLECFHAAAYIFGMRVFNPFGKILPHLHNFEGITEVRGTFVSFTGADMVCTPSFYKVHHAMAFVSCPCNFN